jgi:hypothetical protein
VNDYGNQDCSEGHQEGRFVGQENRAGGEEPAQRPTAQRQVSFELHSIWKNKGLPANTAQPFIFAANSSPPKPPYLASALEKFNSGN